MSEAAQATGNLALPLEPLTVTVREAERLTGLGTTTIYKLGFGAAMMRLLDETAN
jgi:hypothetical protein